MSNKITAIIVTHNRLELLKQCILAVESQSRPVDGVIVIDNGCDQPTREWCLGQGDRFICVVQHNQGSAGGVARGLEVALDLDYNWFWIMDDDTLPVRNALECLVRNPRFGQEDTGFLSSINLRLDGGLSNVVDPLGIDTWLDSVLLSRSLGVKTASFVSLLVNRTALETVGLPIRGFYIWVDDIEFTQRLSSVFKGYIVLDSFVAHPNFVGPLLSESSVSAIKQWCFVRNRVALAYLQGGTRVRMVGRLIKLVARLWVAPTPLGCGLRFWLSVLDGVVFGVRNRQFRRPVRGTPVERTPTSLPWILRYPWLGVSLIG